MTDMPVTDEFKRFDLKRPVMRANPALLALAAALSIPDVISHRTVIKRNGTDGIKPPYLLLCNHNAFQDFKVAIKCTYPHRTNFVVAIDGFIGRENLLRYLGCICKRKFTRDFYLVRQLMQVIKNGDIAVLYPEARYSLCGTTAVLPASLGKLCKMLNVPVVVLICHGHHINSPFWNLKGKHVSPLEAEFSLLFTPQELTSLTPDEINARIVEAFQYDDFRWQSEHQLRVDYPKRAEGLHKVLYQCPSCRKEFRMTSRGDELHCSSCGKTWKMTEYGSMEAVDGVTEFSHIPDWYEWERENVRREVEEGTYSSGDLTARVMSLPNAKKFIPFGDAVLRHDMEGFHVDSCKDNPRSFHMEISAPTQYSVHIEYEYLGKYGDCVDLNTYDDTWYISPYGQDFAVTKMALATEELYFYYLRKKGKLPGKGLA